MAPRKLSLAAIAKVALALPGVAQGTWCGAPAFRFESTLITRLGPPTASDLDALPGRAIEGATR